MLKPYADGLHSKEALRSSVSSLTMAGRSMISSSGPSCSAPHEKCPVPADRKPDTRRIFPAGILFYDFAMPAGDATLCKVALNAFAD